MKDKLAQKYSNGIIEHKPTTDMPGRWRLALVTLVVLQIFEFVLGEVLEISPDQNPPNGLVKANDGVEYSDLSIALINDLILIAQIFVTCVPTGALAPVAPNFVRISCMFNLLSALSLLSLSILLGWDRLDESRIFKMQIRRAFEGWAQGHTRLSERGFILDGTVANNVRQFCNWLDLDFDLYVKSGKRRLICAAFRMGQATVLQHRGFSHEVCVTKEGIRRLGENRLSRLPLETVKKVAKYLIRGGLLSTALNPPLFLSNAVQTYGAFSQEVQHKINQMVTIIDQENWDGREVGFTIEEDQNLLLSFSYSVNRLL